MITDLLINLVYVFSLGIARLVSSWGDVPTDNSITSSLVTFQGYYMGVNSFLPLATILEIVAFVCVFEGIYGTYKLIRWGYQKIPGIN